MPNITNLGDVSEKDREPYPSRHQPSTINHQPSTINHQPSTSPPSAGFFFGATP